MNRIIDGHIKYLGWADAPQVQTQTQVKDAHNGLTLSMNPILMPSKQVGQVGFQTDVC